MGRFSFILITLLSTVFLSTSLQAQGDPRQNPKDNAIQTFEQSMKAQSEALRKEEEYFESIKQEIVTREVLSSTNSLEKSPNMPNVNDDSLKNLFANSLIKITKLRTALVQSTESLFAIYQKSDCSNPNISKAMALLREGTLLADAEFNEQNEKLKMRKEQADIIKIQNDLPLSMDLTTKAQELHTRYTSKRNKLNQELENELNQISTWRGLLSSRDAEANYIRKTYVKELFHNALHSKYLMMTAYNRLANQCFKEGRLIERSKINSPADMGPELSAPAKKSQKK